MKDVRSIAFETFKRAILKPVENTNSYTPKIRIKSTVKPDREYTYNEIANNIHLQVR